mgnify:CR=1 FL=1
MKRNRKAKILATLGPASSSSKTIENIFKAGCDVFRLNFSHGSVEIHRQNLEWIRQLEEKYNHATCILADLQGPKLRVGEFENTEEILKKGQKFTLDTSSKLGDNKRVTFPHAEIYDHLTPNTTLLINDGRIRLQVLEQNQDSLITEVLNDGVISNNKGVNIPDVILPIDSLTSKDKADLQKALEMNVDWVALSFVQQAEDIHKLKKIVDGKALVMAKIEKPSAVKNIDDIIQAADGIMIARGDLGVEMPTEKVPIAQKNIIKRCRHYGKPRLQSAVAGPEYLRAPAADLARRPRFAPRAAPAERFLHARPARQTASAPARGMGRAHPGQRARHHDGRGLQYSHDRERAHARRARVQRQLPAQHADPDARVCGNPRGQGAGDALQDPPAAVVHGRRRRARAVLPAKLHGEY